MSRYCTVRKQLFSLVVILTGALAAGFGAAAQAADHYVTASTSTVDCNNYAGGVRAGDTITLAGGNRGDITFKNCVGNANNRIIIRNDTAAGSRTTIQGTGTFAFLCKNCEWLTIDGTGKWAGAPDGVCGFPDGRTQCGIRIKCSNDGTNSWIRLNGSTKNLTVQGVEVDGGFPNCDSAPPGIGIAVNDHNYKLADHPGEWREGIVIQKNYVHDMASECLYIGPNQSKNGIGDLQLRNNEIGYNLIENCGYDGIELKSTIEGLSKIHHNIVRNTGRGHGDNTNGNNGHGISLFESGFTDVHHNWVENTSAAGTGGACFTQYIQYLTTVTSAPSNFFNNVAVDCHGNGISAGRRDTSIALPVPTMTHNTVINSGRIGLNTSSNVTGSGAIRDNIACGSAASDVSSSGGVQATNNRTGSCSANRFADLSNRDLRLTVDSPAKDTGSNSEVPADDYNGVSRPQGGAPDQGAFEFVIDGAVVRPKPPAFAAIE